MEFPNEQAEHDFYLNLEKSEIWKKLEEFLIDRESELINLMEEPSQKKNVLIGRLIEVRFLRTLPKALANMGKLAPTVEEEKVEILKSNLGIPDPTTGIV